MFGWKPSPHDVRRKVAEDWQLLQDVKWAERAGEFIPLVGSGANALKIFNQKRGTSHILDGSFRKFLSGSRPFDDGWRCRDGVRPGCGSTTSSMAAASWAPDLRPSRDSIRLRTCR